MVAQINALVGNATLDPNCKRTENRASGNVCTCTHVYCKKGNMSVHQRMKGQTCSTYMSILALYSVFKRKEILPGLLAHANNSRTQKAEVGDCGLETSLGYRTRAYLKKKEEILIRGVIWVSLEDILSQFLENKCCMNLLRSV